MAKKTNLSDEEVVALLMTSPVTVCEWLQRGMLHVRIDAGGHRRFGLQDVHHFAREQSIGLSCPDRGRLRILIVEGDRRISRLLTDLFDTPSGTVEACAVHDAFEAGRKMLTFRPDVVLLDFHLPRHDGFEICRRIKTDPASQGVRVIALTRSDDAALKQRILMAGAEACVPKPLSSRALFETLGLSFEPRVQGEL